MTQVSHDYCKAGYAARERLDKEIMLLGDVLNAVYRNKGIDTGWSVKDYDGIRRFTFGHHKNINNSRKGLDDRPHLVEKRTDGTYWLKDSDNYRKFRQSREYVLMVINHPNVFDFKDYTFSKPAMPPRVQVVNKNELYNRTWDQKEAILKEMAKELPPLFSTRSGNKLYSDKSGCRYADSMIHNIVCSHPGYFKRVEGEVGQWINLHHPANAKRPPVANSQHKDIADCTVDELIIKINECNAEIERRKPLGQIGQGDMAYFVDIKRVVIEKVGDGDYPLHFRLGNGNGIPLEWDIDREGKDAHGKRLFHVSADSAIDAIKNGFESQEAK
jgi:hypothetical protein